MTKNYRLCQSQEDLDFTKVNFQVQNITSSATEVQKALQRVEERVQLQFLGSNRTLIAFVQVPSPTHAIDLYDKLASGSLNLRLNQLTGNAEGNAEECGTPPLETEKQFGILYQQHQRKLMEHNNPTVPQIDQLLGDLADTRKGVTKKKYTVPEQYKDKEHNYYSGYQFIRDTVDKYPEQVCLLMSVPYGVNEHFLRKCLKDQGLGAPRLILFNREVCEFTVRLEFEDSAKVDELVNKGFQIPSCHICDKHEILVKKVGSRFSDPFQMLMNHQVKIQGLDLNKTDPERLVEVLESKFNDRVIEVNASIDPTFQILQFKSENTVKAIGAGMEVRVEGTSVKLSQFHECAQGLTGIRLPIVAKLSSRADDMEKKTTIKPINWYRGDQAKTYEDLTFQVQPKYQNPRL